MADTRGFRSATRKLARMATNLKTKPQKTTAREARGVAETAKSIVLYNDTYASGMLYEGIGVESDKIPFGIRVTIVSNAPHSGYVEYGTGDYNLPIGPRYDAPDFSHGLVMAIMRWMIVKPSFTLAPTYYRAFKIAEAIANGASGRGRGTPAQPFMNPAWYENELKLKKAVRNSVKKSVRV